MALLKAARGTTEEEYLRKELRDAVQRGDTKRAAKLRKQLEELRG